MTRAERKAAALELTARIRHLQEHFDAALLEAARCADLLEQARADLAFQRIMLATETQHADNC